MGSCLYKLFSFYIDSYINDGTCKCHINCHVHKYDTFLSFAELSKLNIERVVLKDPSKKRQIKTTFKKASEDLQRHKKEIFIHDDYLFKNITRKYDMFSQSLHESLEYIKDYGSFCEKNRIFNLKREDLLERLFQFILSFDNEIQSSLNMLHTDENINMSPSQIFSIFGNETPSYLELCKMNRYVNKNQCDAIGEATNIVLSANKYFLRMLRFTPGNFNLDFCGTKYYLDNCNMPIDWVVQDGGEILIKNLTAQALEIRRLLRLSDYQEAILPPITDYNQYVLNVAILINDTNIRKYLTEYLDTSTVSVNCSSTRSSSSVQSCVIFARLSSIYYRDILDNITELQIQTTNELSVFNSYYSHIQTMVSSILTTYNFNIKPLIQLMIQYKNKSFTKESFMIQYDTMSTLTYLQNILSQIAFLKIEHTNINTTIENIARKLQNCLTLVQTLSYSPLNNETLFLTPLGEELVKYSNRSLSSDIFSEVLSEQMNLTASIFPTLTSSVIDSSNDLVIHMTELLDDLKIYRKQLQVDSKFYV